MWSPENHTMKELQFSHDQVSFSYKRIKQKWYSRWVNGWFLELDAKQGPTKDRFIYRPQVVAFPDLIWTQDTQEVCIFGNLATSVLEPGSSLSVVCPELNVNPGAFNTSVSVTQLPRCLIFGYFMVTRQVPGPAEPSIASWQPLPQMALIGTSAGSCRKRTKDKVAREHAQREETPCGRKTVELLQNGMIEFSLCGGLLQSLRISKVAYSLSESSSQCEYLILVVCFQWMLKCYSVSVELPKVL